MYFNLGESNLELVCETSDSVGFCVRRPKEEFSASWLREGCSKQKPNGDACYAVRSPEQGTYNSHTKPM